MKFKVGDIVRTIFDRKMAGVVVRIFECPLGATYHISWDNGDYSIGHLDSHLVLSSWDDFQEKMKERLN